jgi:hypothetical protein
MLTSMARTGRANHRRMSKPKSTNLSALYEAAMQARSTEPHSVERRKRGPRR